MKQLSHNKKLIHFVAIVLLLLATWLVERYTNTDSDPVDSNYSALQTAIENQQSDIQVEGSGIIIKVLPDDTHGSKHQRLLIKLDNGHTILIAHNIDLAPRVKNPKEGNAIDFYGEFEWNNKGGVVHWTHHDPGNRHPDGWLKYQGKIYQ